MSQPLPYRDDSLEGRFLAGDPETVGKIIRWIAVVIASSRFWRLRGEWLDMHQEVMGRLVESLRRQRFDASQDFRTYVQGVARYTAMEALRPKLRLISTDDAGDSAAADSPEVDEDVISRQMARQVLDHASEGCRQLFRAYYYEQRNYEEIAAAQGLPVGTVKSRLARCLDSAHRMLRAGRAGRLEKL